MRLRASVRVSCDSEKPHRTRVSSSERREGRGWSAEVPGCGKEKGALAGLAIPKSNFHSPRAPPPRTGTKRHNALAAAQTHDIGLKVSPAAFEDGRQRWHRGRLVRQRSNPNSATGGGGLVFARGGSLRARTLREGRLPFMPLAAEPRVDIGRMMGQREIVVGAARARPAGKYPPRRTALQSRAAGRK